MQFNKNKTAFIHRWFPFVEGYSKEFIQSIVQELNYKPSFCIDPFAGSGTTPVELQHMGIKCASFEVSPFMHLLSKTKLQQDYNLKFFRKNKEHLKATIQLVKGKKPLLQIPPGETIVEKDNLDKWIFNKKVMDGILDIKFAISQIPNSEYKNLFKVALASILLEVSNVFRNGKCVSYKKEWQNINISRGKVHKLFFEKLEVIIEPDIALLSKTENEINNYNICYLEDVRKGLVKQRNKQFDLLITSPPYLNSRDYTDIYRVELWVLDLITSYKEMFDLRKHTFISHVQINHGDIKSVNVDLLKRTVSKINKSKDSHWNDIPTMINGYFRDMDFLYFTLKDKMIPGKKLFMNVANSAYCGVEIKVDEICAQIAEKNGFTVNEIRTARMLKTSAQQKMKVDGLKETVIVMTS